jgi:hypothetical protein
MVILLFEGDECCPVACWQRANSRLPRALRFLARHFLNETAKL